MKKIAELNDRTVLGQEGKSDRPPRFTARAVLRREDGLYAVLHAKKFGLYSLPGGGVEDGETPLEALEREVREETGCKILSVEEIGVVSENRGSLDYTQISYYYFVSAAQEGDVRLTADEAQNGTELLWHALPEVRALLSGNQPTTVQQKYLKARDLAALEAYLDTANAGICRL